MIKSVTILFLFLLLLQTAGAQWEIGLIGGLNRSSLSGDKPTNATYKTLIGPALGVLIETQLTKDVQVGLQPQFLQRGTKVARKIPDVREPKDSLNFKIDYISIPLMFKVYGNSKRTYLVSGLDVGFPVSASIENLDSSQKEDVLDRLKSVDVMVSMGIGFRFPVKQFFWAFELRYFQGLFNLNNPSSSEESPLDFVIRSTGFQLFSSISLPLGKSN